MAIAFDASSQDARYSTGTTLTFSHTCTGSDRFLWVYVYTYKAGSGASISGVTYNGVAMTELESYQKAQNEIYCQAFYLANPASGANDIVVTHVLAPYCWALASSYTGVDQTTPIDSSNADGGNGSQTSADRVASTTVVDSDCWLVSACISTGNVEGTVVSGSVREWQDETHRWGQIADSNGTVGTGSQNITHEINNGNWAWHVASLAEASGGGTDYPMTASVGTFVLTGIATAFNLGRAMVASAGSFILTGIDTAFALGKGFVAETGSFILTGIDTALRKAISMTASVGSFILTGIDVVLTYTQASIVLVAETGTFVLTGISAILRASAVWFNTASKNVASWFNKNKS